MNIDKKYRYGTRRMKTSIRRQRRASLPDWAIATNLKWGMGRPLCWDRVRDQSQQHANVTSGVWYGGHRVIVAADWITQKDREDILNDIRQAK